MSHVCRREARQTGWPSGFAKHNRVVRCQASNWLRAGRPLWVALLLLLVGGGGAGCNRRPREAPRDISYRMAPATEGGGVIAPAEVYAPADTLVRVILHNATAETHNFVLVQPGRVDEVLASARAPTTGMAGDASEQKALAAILARGPWVAPGEKKAVAFTAPPAGFYEFTCTCDSASHHTPIRGKFVVQ